MLSAETAKFLNIGCEKSDALYEEGGLIYTYTFGYHRAHSFFDIEMLNKAINPRYLDDEEIGKINLFYESALVQPGAKSVTTSTIEYVHKLLELLKRDFSNMYSFIGDYTDDVCSREMTLTFIEKNDFHTLELFWSID